MRQPDENGFPNRIWIERFAAKGRAPWAQIVEERPELPYQLRHLWGWFTELDQARGQGLSGPAALTYPSVDAWSRLTGRNPLPLEVEALFQLDLVWRYPGNFDDDE